MTSLGSELSMPPLALLRHLFEVAVQRAMPASVLAAHLPAPPRAGRTVVLGAGKASAAMAQALEAAWPPDAALSGLVISPYGHCPPDYAPRRLEVVEAAHPVPDAAGLAATQRLLQLTQGLSAQDQVICLISGGGSALLCAPASGLSLADKQAVNQALLRSGASIDEMNCVRKHLSAIKGGRLAAACAPAQVLTLLISDVPGDDPATIASGPTVPDPSRCAEALAICQRYAIPLPELARAGLLSGALETPKPSDPRLARAEWRLLATPQQSLQAAAQAASALGLPAHVLSDAMEGEARDLGRMHAALALQVARRSQPFAKPCVILSGGEATVSLSRGSTAATGQGGRATEFLLGCALALNGAEGIYALAADTDGIDGVCDNAGAVLSPSSLARARALGLQARVELDAHNARGFFAPLDDLLICGPTFTNVNDFRALLVL